jgi:hypothetical protein
MALNWAAGPSGVSISDVENKKSRTQVSLAILYTSDHLDGKGFVLMVWVCLDGRRVCRPVMSARTQPKGLP